MQIEQTQKDGIIILRLNGNLLGETYGAPLLDGIKQGLDQGVNKFILDVNGLKFVNSTGIGTLISAMTRARNAGGELALMQVPDQLHKMLLITKLDTLFHSCANEEEAREILNKN